VKQVKVRDAITQTTGSLGALTEVFSPCVEEASPGTRLMDLYRSQVTFDGYDPYGEEPLNRRRTEVNTLFNVARGQPRTVCFGTDASVPKTTTRHHTTAAFVCEGLINLSYSSAWAAGKVLSSDGELFAIRSAIVKGCSFENCDRIVLFTDSIGMAKRAVDPSVHSGQAHSLAVCKTIAAWLSGHPERKVLFVETPSKLKWGIQHKAHLEARGLPPIPHRATPITSLDGM
jgi:hypothetical protein